MIEVEIKAGVEDVSKIKEKLDKINAKFIKSENQDDKVFGNPIFLDSENKMIEGGIVARIRVLNDKKILEFKEILREKGGAEIKSELKNLEIGINFLKKLGFNEAFSVQKTREEYSYKDFVIALDNVNRLGEFIEIEKVVDSLDEIDNARKGCIELLNLISPDSEIENRKYGDLMQEIINKEKQVRKDD